MLTQHASFSSIGVSSVLTTPPILATNVITPLPLNTSLQTAFLGRLVKKNRHFIPREFVQLEERLWGQERELDFIFIRDWYPANASKIFAEFAGNRRNMTIVAGNKGTGKTVFSIFLVIEALREGFAVVYETARERVWIVGEKRDRRRDFSDIESCFRAWQMTPVLESGVYSLKDLDHYRFTDLAQRHSAIHIVDVGDSYTAEIDPNGPKVIISSPNFDKLKRISEVHNVVYHYLPTWTWEEIEKFNTRLPSAEDDAKSAYVRRDPDDLRVMFETFGGVPRTLFKRRSVKAAFGEIEKCLSDTSVDVLRQTFTFSTFAQLPKALPGLLVNIKENPSEPGTCLVEIASSTILYRMAQFYFQAKNFELISFLNAKSPERMVGQIRGELVEICMHEAFGSMTSQVDLEMRRLGEGSSSFVKLNLPPFRRSLFAKLSMDDITSIRVNEYFQPLVCNFPAVDAIALMARSYFDGPSATGFCGVGFQATISKKKRKGVPREELMRVRSKLRALQNDPSLPLYLVFVSVVDGLNSRQRLGPTREPVDDEFAQFVIRGISFENLSKLEFMKVAENDASVDSDEQD